MSRIAICAPSTPITRDVAERVGALAAAEFPELTLQFHPQCFVQEGHFAGSDEVRLKALLDCANDPAFDAVWFAKGGYGANRIAARAIEAMSDEAQDKTFLGYSDCGYLLAALYRGRIGHPVHGPMPVDIRRQGGDEAIRRALGWLAGDAGGLEPSLDETPSGDHTQHLRGVAGIRLGRVSDVPENDRPFGCGAQDIARDWCERAGIPFLGTADIGHDAANKIVPFGLARTPARS